MPGFAVLDEVSCNHSDHGDHTLEHYWGELAALAGALSWAIATLIFSKFAHHLSAMQMTLTKGCLALTLMLGTLLLMPLPSAHIALEPMLWLALSGFIGIAIGDSAYFAALRRIGPNRTLLLESLAPPLSGILALCLLGDHLGWQSWLGVVVTTAGVTWVVMKPDPEKGYNRAGLAYGLLASCCQATGVVISHYALVTSQLPALWGATLRLGCGTLAVALWLAVSQPTALRQLSGLIYRQPGRRYLFLGILVGTYLALWLQQSALKLANPAVAQTLLATSPLFLLPLALWQGEALSKRLVLGTGMALFGILLFFWR